MIEFSEIKCFRPFNLRYEVGINSTFYQFVDIFRPIDLLTSSLNVKCSILLNILNLRSLDPLSEA